MMLTIPSRFLKCIRCSIFRRCWGSLSRDGGSVSCTVYLCELYQSECGTFRRWSRFCNLCRRRSSKYQVERMARSANRCISKTGFYTFAPATTSFGKQTPVGFSANASRDLTRMRTGTSCHPSQARICPCTHLCGLGTGSSKLCCHPLSRVSGRSSISTASKWRRFRERPWLFRSLCHLNRGRG